MANMNHNPEKDILKLASAVLRYLKMPPKGNGKYVSDLQYLAEYVVPLTERMKKRYSRRRVPGPRVKK